MLLGYLCQHMSKLPSRLLTGSTKVQQTIAQVRAPSTTHSTTRRLSVNATTCVLQIRTQRNDELLATSHAERGRRGAKDAPRLGFYGNNVQTCTSCRYFREEWQERIKMPLSTHPPLSISIELPTLDTTLLTLHTSNSAYRQPP